MACATAIRHKQASRMSISRAWAIATTATAAARLLTAITPTAIKVTRARWEARTSTALLTGSGIYRATRRATSHARAAAKTACVSYALDLQDRDLRELMLFLFAFQRLADCEQEDGTLSFRVR